MSSIPDNRVPSQWTLAETHTGTGAWASQAPTFETTLAELLLTQVQAKALQSELVKAHVDCNNMRYTRSDEDFQRLCTLQSMDVHGKVGSRLERCLALHGTLASAMQPTVGEGEPTYDGILGVIKSELDESVRYVDTGFSKSTLDAAVQHGTRSRALRNGA
jgi:hypothetical protein